MSDGGTRCRCGKTCRTCYGAGVLFSDEGVDPQGERRCFRSDLTVVDLASYLFIAGRVEHDCEDCGGTGHQDPT